MNQQKPKTNKNGDNETVRGNPSRGLPRWFHLTGTHPQVHLVVRASTVLILTSRRTETATFALKTRITRAPCRRRSGGAVPRAENVGDLITADHRVLSDNCESRNNHRCAVVVQDLATQWIQAYPCKNKNFSGNTKELAKSSWSRIGSLKDIYTDNSLEFGKACEDLSWNHCTSTPHRSETNGIAERAVRRIKQGTSPELLQSGLG